MNLPNIKDTLAVLNLMKSAAESLRLLHNESEEEDVDFAHSQHDVALKEYNKLWKNTKQVKRYFAIDLNNLDNGDGGEDGECTFTSIENAEKFLVPRKRIVKVTNYNFYTLFYDSSPGFPTRKAVEEWIEKNGKTDCNEYWVIGEVDCDELMVKAAANW